MRTCFAGLGVHVLGIGVGLGFRGRMGFAFEILNIWDYGFNLELL